MKDETEADWSGRHVRLRFELVAVSALLFLVTHYPLKPDKNASAIIFLPFEAFDVPPGLFTTALFVLWVYLALHFLARTIDEYSVINRHTAVIKEILTEVDAAGRKANSGLEHLSVGNALQRVGAALRLLNGEVGSPIPLQLSHVTELSEQTRRLADAIETLRGRGEVSVSHRDQIERLSVLLSQVSPHRWESLQRAMDESRLDLEKGMVEYRGFLEKEIPSILKPLVDELNSSIARLDKINNIFKTGSFIRRLERHLFSMALPGIASLVLACLSFIEWQWGSSTIAQTSPIILR